MSLAKSTESWHEERFRAAGWGGGRPASHTGATSTVAERAERTSRSRGAGWESAASSGSKTSLTPLIEQLASPPPTGTAWNSNTGGRRRSDTGSRSLQGSRDSVPTPANHARGLSSAPGSKEPFNSPFRLPSLHSMDISLRAPVESESTPGRLDGGGSRSEVLPMSLGASIRAMAAATPIKGSMEAMVSPGRAAPAQGPTLSFSQLAERSKQAAARQHSVTSRHVTNASRPSSAGSRPGSAAGRRDLQQGASNTGTRPTSAAAQQEALHAVGAGGSRLSSSAALGDLRQGVSAAGPNSATGGRDIIPMRSKPGSAAAQGEVRQDASAPEPGSTTAGQDGAEERGFGGARPSRRGSRRLLSYQRSSESRNGSFVRRSSDVAIVPSSVGTSAGTTPRDVAHHERAQDAARGATENSDTAALNPNEDIVQRWVDNSRISIKTPSQGQIISLAADATGDSRPAPKQRWEKRNLHRTSRTRLFGLLRGGHRFYSLVRRVSRDEDEGDEVNVLQAEREPGFSPSYAIYKGNGDDKELVGVVQCTSLAMDTFIFMVPPEGSPKAVCDPNSDPVQLAVGFQNVENQRHMTVLIPETGGQAANNSTGTEDLGIAEEIQRSMKRAQDGENSLPNTKVLRTRLVSGKKQQMNFGGRVLFASLKNVQLEVAQQNAWAGGTPTTGKAAESAQLAFQCGRRGDDTFACDFLSPTLSEHQAFALSIAIMVPKACFLFL